MFRLRGGREEPVSARRRAGALCRAAFLLAAAVEALPAQVNILVEPFDSVAPPALPSGWRSSRNRTPLQNDFESSASAPHSPPNALVSTNASISQELISPAVSFIGTSPSTLSFALRQSATHDASLLVEASTDGGEEFGLVIGDTLRPSPEVTYRTVELPLPALLLRSSPVRFRWRTIGGQGGTSGTLRIDDVVITVDALWDVALAGVRCEPPAARASSVVRASVRIAGAGIGRVAGAEILLGLDLDSSGTLSGSEIWSRATLPLSPVRGETTDVDLEFRAPDPGEYRLVATVDSPGDQRPGNNTAYLSFLSGYPLHALVLNEIMYAPAAPEPEWIELASTDTSTILLSRWRVGDSSSPEGKEIASPGAKIPGRGLVLLCRSASALAEVRPECGGACIEMSALPSLNNTGDCVVVRDFAGCTIDSVCYMPAWGGAAGRSLERRDDRRGSDDAANWGSSTDSAGATPCRRNSIAVLDTDLALLACTEEAPREGETAVLRVTLRNDGRATVASASVTCVELEDSDGTGVLFVARGEMTSPLGGGESTAVSLAWENPRGGTHHLLFRLSAPGDLRTANDTLTLRITVRYRDPFLRISEIMAQPRQGEAEYVEVVNAGGEAVDLAGWSVGDARRVTAREYLLSRKRLCIAPGAYFVLASDSTLLGRYAPCDTHLVTIAGTASLQLNNEADGVVLRDPFGRAVDSVAYDARWHSPVLTDPVGRSLERISAGLPSSDGGNWGTSVAGAGGTPGCRNSIWCDNVPPVARMEAHPNPFSPDGDGREDHTIIRFEIPRACGWMLIRIFDVGGRMVRVLANNEPCGHAGGVVWDGLDDGRRRVRIGVYVILLEVAGQDRAELTTARGSVVVAGRLR
jgi:hypothetical protein